MCNTHKPRAPCAQCFACSTTTSAKKGFVAIGEDGTQHRSRPLSFFQCLRVFSPNFAAFSINCTPVVNQPLCDWRKHQFCELRLPYLSVARPQVDEMLHRLYAPILWRSLRVANPVGEHERGRRSWTSKALSLHIYLFGDFLNTSDGTANGESPIEPGP